MINTLFLEEHFMREALKEARKALENNKFPIGAVVVYDNRIIARAHTLKDNAHAEMQIFTEFLEGQSLKDCTLYVTVEPCEICASAAFWVQMGKIVYGAADKKRGFQKTNLPLLHPKTILVSNVLGDESRKLICEFNKAMEYVNQDF